MAYFPSAERLQSDFKETERFDVSDPDMLAHLRREGYVVVKDVVGGEWKGEDKLEELTALLWNFLVTATGSWQRGNPTTWHQAAMPQDVWQPKTGIVEGKGVGQSDFLWAVRMLPRVQEAFARVWGVRTEELITSFDGCNVFLPWTTEQTQNKTNPMYFHVDQGITLATGQQEAVQGLVSLYDADQHTGGLCVVPGSHLRHCELASSGILGKGNHCSIPQTQTGRRFVEDGETKQRLVSCKAGDLILWDSRTIHCNTPAILMPRECSTELLRAVAYVCMTPFYKTGKTGFCNHPEAEQKYDPTQDWRKDARGQDWLPNNTIPGCCVAHQRRAIYEGTWTTTHWPHLVGLKCRLEGAPPVSFDAAPSGRQRLVDPRLCPSSPRASLRAGSADAAALERHTLTGTVV